jgi:hypothetical protein
MNKMKPLIKDLTEEEIRLYNSLKILSFPFLSKDKSKEEIIEEQSNFEKKFVFKRKKEEYLTIMFNKKKKINELECLKFWCTYGMTPKEMHDAKIKDQFKYLNSLLKRYKKQFSKEEYESINRSLKILYLSNAMEYAKSNLKNHNVMIKTRKKIIDDAENTSI